MSVIDFARALRALPHGRRIPILVVTTRSVREEILAAVDAGVNDFVLKPFTPLALKEKIDQLLWVATCAAA